MPLEIVTVPCRENNYAYLLRDAQAGSVALVDAPDAGAVMQALDQRGWRLDTILLTHHHADHTDGVDELRRTCGARVLGGEADRHRLPRLDEGLRDGDRVAVGASTGAVLEVSGHTMGHIAFHFPDDAALFSADSLMVMGCGRLFEGTAEVMWKSLRKMAALPPQTRIFSGHEYTESNLRFALSLGEPNAELGARADSIRALRAKGDPTMGPTLQLERATNPFLRAGEAGMKAALGMDGAPDVEVFAELRRRKDTF